MAAAAFGDRPGDWPLPAAATPAELWLRAVAAGGQGRYGSAYHDLAALPRAAGRGALASLAHSTLGSFLRQQGWHTLARGWDGRALALAGTDPAARATWLLTRCRADGTAMFAASRTAGDAERARPVADAALRAAETLGLTPLRWALACLLIDLGSVTFSARELHEIRDICAGQVRRAGGTWRSA
ncbi:hypothetical protein A5714_13300 [Mycobacterium sp. E2462]|uniref:hypothetical protein n=1 Tax=Mycobacterium sp. E2462 TaxID=1834133 RepID=UPI00080184F9|nr:hypothetical protein [Mycobacterium sp. E2462]OBI14684.1 hypothetical protein A5714_13300 [Mycobacterium sp. E2462]